MFHSVDFPIAPRKFPVFYGWVIVAAGTVGTLSSIPGQTMGVSVFTDSLMDTLHLTRVELSGAYMMGTIFSSFLLAPGGRLLDRYGTRLMGVLIPVCFAFCLAGMAYCGAIYRTLDTLLGERFQSLTAWSVVFVGFLSIRFFGQGMLSMIPRVMIGKWFDKRRGLAIGVGGFFISFGFGSAPLVLNYLIEGFGWRGAYFALALWTGLGASTIAWIFYREQPEDCGLNKDGLATSDSLDQNGGRRLATVRDFTVAEARRSYAFWVFSLGLATQGLTVTAITFHILSLARTAGLREEQGLAIFLPMAVFAVTSNLIGGWASDKVKLKYALMVMMVAQAVGTTGMLFMAAFWGRCLTIAGYGIAGGLFGVMVGVAWPRFFGLQHLGAISGMNMAIMVFASAIGPFLFGLSYQQTGSYATGIAICLALPLAVLLAAFRADNPQEKTHDPA